MGPYIMGTKFKETVVEKKVAHDEFRGFGLVRAFRRLGWESILHLNVQGDLTSLIAQWMDTCKLDADAPSLTGYVNNVPYTITIGLIRETFDLDTLREDPDDPNSPPLVYTILGSKQDPYAGTRVPEHVVHGEDHGLSAAELMSRQMLRPFPRFLLMFVTWLINPRGSSDPGRVLARDMSILAALMSGFPKYSLAHIIFQNLEDAAFRSNKGRIPHAYLLSTLLVKLEAARPGVDKWTKVTEQHATLRRATFFTLEFEVTDREGIIRCRNHGPKTRGEYRVLLEELDPDDRPTQHVPPRIPHRPSQPNRPRPPRNPPAAQHIPEYGEISMASLHAMLVTIQEQQARLYIASQTQIWEQHRLMHHYEQHQEHVRSAFDYSAGYTHISRDDYLAGRFPDETDPPQEYRYPAMPYVSRYPPAPNSQYYQVDPPLGYVPQPFQSFLDSLFGSYAPPLPPPPHADC